MALYAVDSIDDAIDATKRFLLPFDWSQWLRLAVVVLFIGGGGGSGLNAITNIPQFASEFGDSGTGSGGFELTATLGTLDPGMLVQTGPPAPDSLPMAGLSLAVILVFVAVFLLVVLALAVISSTMEFVFVESLASEEIHVRRYFKRNFGNGVRLFLFRLLYGIVSVLLLVIVGAGLAFLVMGPPSQWSVEGALGALLLLVPLLLVYAIVDGNIRGFTTVFVVPIMIHEDRGVLSSWARLWGSIKAEWKQYLAYAFFGFVLALGVGLIATFALIPVVIVLGIPVAILAFAAMAIGGTASAVLLWIIGAVALVLFFVAVLLIQVPLQAFLRYYALLVLGDVREEFDLIPEVRADVRS